MVAVGLYTDMRNPEEFGISNADHYARWLDRFVMADELGADAIWLSEHHFYDDGYLPQPLTLAAAVAARTRQARIGTAILLAALRHPLHIAEEAAIVDILSAGRLDLGVGVGYRPSEFEAFGVDLRSRYELLERTTERITEWWTSGAMTPRPVQDPIPMWGGFFGPRGARLAGRLGMGLLTSLHAAGPLLAPYLAGLNPAGQEPRAARVRLSVPVLLSDDPESIAPIVAPRLAYQADSYIRHDATGPLAPKVVPGRGAGEGGEHRGVRILRPAEASQWIAAEIQGLPVDQVFCWASPGVLPDSIIDRHIELLFTEFAPRLAGVSPSIASG